MSPRALASFVTPGIVAVTVVAAACSDSTTGPTPRASQPQAPTAAMLSSGPCEGIEYSRRVDVSSADKLRSALTYARPGDLILLADGTYWGGFSARVAGTAEQRITICGSQNAVIDFGRITDGHPFTIRAAYNTIKGLTLKGGIEGLGIQGASYTVVDGITIREVGQAALAVRQFSKGVKILNSNFINTGRYNPKYGSGLYLGTDNTQWCQWTNCQMDVIDSLEVANNHVGPGVTQTVLILKEGTRNAYVHDNVLDGRDQSTAYGMVYNIVNAKGDRSRIVNNVIQNGPKDGIGNYQLYANTGNNNYYAGNTITSVGGYGIYISSNTSGNVVKCSNTVSGASRGYSNVRCVQ
jgi:hypothetical protein